MNLDLAAQAQTGDAREPVMPGIGQIQDSVEPGPPNPGDVGTENDDDNAKEAVKTGETDETGGSSAVVARTAACLLATLFSL